MNGLRKEVVPVMKKYVLVTAARNEARYIRRPLEAIVSQTIRPVRWVIVSDASVDDTDTIAREFAERFPFIDFLRREASEARDFASQVYAQRVGWERLAGQDFDFIGMLDADISLDPDYYERILAEFESNPRLGIAGGFIHEEHRGVFRSRRANSVRSVAGGIQLFRRRCFEEIGGYIPLRWGGMDTVAEIMSRMRGWEVSAIPQLPVYHHKPGESWSLGALKRRVCEGRMDHSLGISPLTQLLKCCRRIAVEPYVLGSVFRLWGYCAGFLRREGQVVPQEVVNALREEHRYRLKLAVKLPASLL